MLKNIRLWIGLIGSLLFLGLFFYRIDLRQVAQALREAQYVYILPAVALYFLSVYLRTVRWRYLLSPLGSYTSGRLFPVVVVGYMANNLLPVRLGEIVRAYFLRERERVSIGSALATVLVERAYDGVALLLLAAVAIYGLVTLGVAIGNNNASGVPWLTLGVVLVVAFLGAVALLTLLAKWPRLATLVTGFSRLAPGRLKERVAKFIGLFIQGLSYLNTPQRHGWMLLLSLAVWVVEGGMYLMMAFAFDLQNHLAAGALVPAVLLVTATSNLAGTIPSSQGGVGPFEFFAAATLVAIGVSRSLSQAYALALHVVLLVPVTVLGLLYLWWSNISLARVWRANQQEIKTELAGAGDPSTVVKGGEKG